MIRIRKSRLLLGVLIAATLVAAAALMLPRAASANGDSEICSLDGYIVSEDQRHSIRSVAAPLDFLGVRNFPKWPGSAREFAGSAEGHDIFLRWSATTCDTDSCSGVVTFSINGCGPVAEAELIAPSIFLADVCQPNDGFGGDGYMTLDTDAGSLGVAPQLYYGASADGPWMALEANGPPYNLTMSDLTAMATAAGAADYTALWLKDTETGRAMLLGDMIRDRPPGWTTSAAGSRTY